MAEMNNNYITNNIIETPKSIEGNNIEKDTLDDRI